jgi:hypothetical protein
MLSPRITRRIKQEVPIDGAFELESTEKEFLNAGKFLHENGIKEDDLVSILKNLYEATAEEYGA